MGGGASIERLPEMDFESAISRFQDPLKQSLNNSSMNSELFIPLVAMRQLSQNLIKYEELDRSRTHFSKSHSLPNHMSAFEGNEHKSIKKQSSDDKLDDLDTALIGDGDFGVIISPLEREHKTLSFSSKKFNAIGTTASSGANKSGIRNKPNLFLSVESDNNLLGNSSGNNNNLNVSSKVNESLAVQPLPSPGAFAHVSPRGTLYVGRLQVRETGIFTMNNESEGPVDAKEKKFMDINTIGTSSSSLSYVNQFQNSYNNYNNDEKFSLENSKEDDSFNDYDPLTRAKTTSFDAATDCFAEPSTFGPSGAKGRNEFIEIGTLGSGASGVVSEAIHVPSLTIVALKILPIHNQEKRRHVSRELGVLFRNLAEMRLLNEKDDSNNNNNNTTYKSTIFTACPNVLSLYNAFIDSRSGLINLVVEYMDGGSLEDLVRQGGCQDEYLLADIARQTLNGLSFLHSNKSVHRDIKPANILCSSNGLVKIADFGISKVLDKTTAFAKTFVGTVCYMSPERISGENHSYSCDIWSFGLTLLAVAKGKFPLVLKDYGPDIKKKSSSGKYGNIDDSGGFDGPVGGAQGYWAVMKAICDDDPPLAGPSFSPSFNSFINSCLKKDQNLRWTADHLLLSDFITEKLDLHGAMLSARSENNNTAGSGSQNISETGHSQSHSHSDIHTMRRISESDQSPATAQLFSVVAAKTGTLSEDHYSVPSKGKDTPLEVRLQIDEQEVYSAMCAIRLKHLERILDKLASKLDLESEDFDFDDTENPFDHIKSPISSRSDESFDDLLEPLPTKGPPPQSILKNNSSSSHSILKNSNRNLTSFDDEDYPNQSLTKSNLGSSTRSVHFQDQPELSVKNNSNSNKVMLEIDPPTDSSNLYYNKKPISLKNKPNLSLNLDDSINNNQNSDFFLPKTSSYFLDSKPIDDSTNKVDRVLETKQLIREERKIQIEEIKKFLPKFNDQGIEIWKKFAESLQLPLGTVLMAAKARLENYVDLN